MSIRILFVVPLDVLYVCRQSNSHLVYTQLLPSVVRQSHKSQSNNKITHDDDFRSNKTQPASSTHIQLPSVSEAQSIPV